MTYLDFTSKDFYEAIKSLLLSKGDRVTLDKGDLLCHLGERNSLIGILGGGSLKYSCPTANGGEQIISFAFTGDLVGSYSAIRNNFPSPVDIVALENSTIYQMPILQIDEAIGLEMRIKLSEAISIKALLNAIDYRCKSHMERYQELTSRFPDIHNRLSNRTIALYLGITPESFCRLRKRLLTTT